MPKTAKLVAMTVDVRCPHCDEPQPNPVNGALNWSTEEIQATPGDLTCDCCGKRYRVAIRQMVPLEGLA